MSQNSLREYIESLTVQEKKLIISSHEKFEAQGYIGDEPVRVYTEKYLIANSIPLHNVTIFMHLITFECYRYFANRYFDE